MKHQISTPQAPAAIGPYSQAIGDQQWVFCSGQIGIDPARVFPVPCSARAPDALGSVKVPASATGAKLASKTSTRPSPWLLARSAREPEFFT